MKSCYCGGENKRRVKVSINADVMSVAEIHQKLEIGYRDVENGRTRNAAEAFTEFENDH